MAGNARRGGSLATLPPWFIAIATSAGGIAAVGRVLASLPADFPAVIVLVVHRPAAHLGHLPAVLGRFTKLPVHVVDQGQAFTPGHVYLARSDSHLTVTPERRFIYRDGTRIRFVPSSASPLMESAAEVFDGRAIAVVLTGGGSDASDGVQTIKAHGGVVIAQDERTSNHWHMPSSAIRTGDVDYVLPVDAIGPMLQDIVDGRQMMTGAGARP